LFLHTWHRGSRWNLVMSGSDRGVADRLDVAIQAAAD
jgi:hypothetical protein